MAITIYPVTPDFVAEVGDVDLAQPLHCSDLAAIKQAFWKYAVLIFPGQRLTPEQHVAFSLLFGPVESDYAIKNVAQQGATQQGATQQGAAQPESLDRFFADQSNLDAQGALWGQQSRQRAYKMGNRQWHTDSSFKRVPGLCSLLYAQRVPPVGGHTEFADQRAAWDALPEPTRRRLAGLVAEHSLITSRERLGFTEFTAEERTRLLYVPQALVRTVPESGRRTLYVAVHAGRILGMAREEGRALIDELIAHVTQRQFVYTHRWREHDLVLWDNRCTMHRGTVYDDLRWRREARRTTVSDRANSCEQEGLPLPQEAARAQQA